MWICKRWQGLWRAYHRKTKEWGNVSDSKAQIEDLCRWLNKNMPSGNNFR